VDPAYDPTTGEPLYDVTTGEPMAGCCCDTGCGCAGTGVHVSVSGVVYPKPIGVCLPDVGGGTIKFTGSLDGEYDVTFDPESVTPCRATITSNLIAHSYHGADCTDEFDTSPTTIIIDFDSRPGVFGASVNVAGGAIATQTEIVYCCKDSITIPIPVSSYDVVDVDGTHHTGTAGGGTVVISMATPPGLGTDDACPCDECCDTYATNLFYQDSPTEKVTLTRYQACTWRRVESVSVGGGFADWTYTLTKAGTHWVFSSIGPGTPPLQCVIRWSVAVDPDLACAPPDGWTMTGETGSCSFSLDGDVLQILCGDPTCPESAPDCCDDIRVSFGTGLNPCFAESELIFSRTGGPTSPTWANTAHHATMFCYRGRLVILIDVSNAICGTCPGSCFIRYECPDTAWDTICPETATAGAFVVVRDDLGGAPPVTNIVCVATPCPTDCTACADTGTATLAGGTGSGSGDTGGYNGAWLMSESSACVWDNGDDGGRHIEIVCVGTQWRFRAYFAGSDPTTAPYFEFLADNTTGCPADVADWGTPTLHNGMTGTAPTLTYS
jgi:hypothetical protein